MACLETREEAINVKKIVLIIMMILWAVSVQAATWYVDSSVPTSGNGSLASPWKDIPNITGVSAGDTVYFSGGASGQSYTATNWHPAAGTKANPVTYAVRQDAGHNAMVTFAGTGRRMTVTDAHSETIFSDTTLTDGFKLLYVEFYDAIWGRGTGYEIAHCYGVAPLSYTDDSFIAHIGEADTSQSHNANSIHDNFFKVWRNRTKGYGWDCLKWIKNANIYNNVLISEYNASYTGLQHNDGIQTAGSYTWVYNNYFEGFISYPIYHEGAAGSRTGWRIFNNVMNTHAPDQDLIDWHAYACMALGVKAAYTLSDYVVANNTCIGRGDTQGIRFNSQGSTLINTYVVNNLVYKSKNIIYYTGTPTVISNNIGGTSGITFVNDSYYPNGDFHLTSSATNAIDHAVSPAPSYLTATFTTDKDGGSRPQGSAWDIGAYEYVGPAPRK